MVRATRFSILASATVRCRQGSEQRAVRIGIHVVAAVGGAMAIVFCRDELAIPTQDRIRRHEAGKVAEHLAAERIAAHRQAGRRR